jgi:hypothetical protein
MKFLIPSLLAYFASVSLADGLLPRDSNSINDIYCPGSIINGICCVGSISGQGVSSISAAIASHTSKVGQDLSSVAAVLSNMDENLKAWPTTHPLYLEKRDTSIASGITCNGVAVATTASNYNDLVSSASSARAAGSTGFGEATSSLFYSVGSVLMCRFRVELFCYFHNINQWTERYFVVFVCWSWAYGHGAAFPGRLCHGRCFCLWGCINNLRIPLSMRDLWIRRKYISKE